MKSLFLSLPLSCEEMGNKGERKQTGFTLSRE